LLAQLVYVSDRSASCTQDQIEAILTSCRKNNPPLNITGILLYSDTRFIQLVEGEAMMIKSLYETIKADSRHSNIMMISFNPIKQKTFPNWHMGAKKLSLEQIDFITTINSEEKQLFSKLLSGQEEKNGLKVLTLLKKLF
jgi:hypothetical protein